MEDKLLEVLDLLETDLKDVDSAVKHLSKSKEAVQSLIDSNVEFISSFKTQMNVMREELDKFAVNINNDTSAVIKKWNQISVDLSNLTERLGKLTTYFESVNFPARLDKIDTSVSTIQQSVISNQNLINDVYKRIDQHAEKQREYYGRSMKRIIALRTILFITLGVIVAGFVLLGMKIFAIY